MISRKDAENIFFKRDDAKVATNNPLMLHAFNDD